MGTSTLLSKKSILPSARPQFMAGLCFVARSPLQRLSFSNGPNQLATAGLSQTTPFRYPGHGRRLARNRFQNRHLLKNCNFANQTHSRNRTPFGRSAVR